MSRVALLLSTAALASTLAGSISEAHACSPPPPPPPSGTFAIGHRMGPRAPKNGGVIFVVSRTQEITEESVIAQLKITVRSGVDEIPGTIRRISSAGLGSKWIWLPTSNGGQLPPGVVHISITSTEEPSALQEPVEADVTIEDRILAPPKIAPNVELRRELVTDRTSPKIVCKWKGQSAACESGPQERQVASRFLGVPNLIYLVPELPQNDAALFEREIELFGRNADGSQGASEVTPVYSAGSSGNFDRPYVEYCAKLRTRLLADGSTSEEQVCVPHGALDLTVSEQDTKRALDQQLSRCETIIHPSGTETSPPGPAADASCAVVVGRRGDGAAGTSVVIALGIVAGVLRRRATRSRHG